MLSSLTDQSQWTFALSAEPHMPSYLYDAADRMHSVTRSTATFYSYDMANRLPDAKIYVFGSYIDEPLRMTSAAGAYYHHANQIYSVAALTDSTGLVVYL